MKPSPARILFRGAIPLLVAAAAFVPPRAQVKGLTSLDLVQLRRVTSLAVRPDGSRVAYLLDVPQPLESDPEGPDRSEVRLVDLIGASRPVATGLDDAGHLRWMPDGRELSFLAREEGSGRRVLHVLNLDDRRVRVVGMQAADIEAYSWAPDGGRVAALAAAPHRGVWITGSSGEPRAVEVPGLVSAVRWSPVGSRLAIAASDGLYVVDADSGARLSHRKIPALLTMEWSPDGESLALIASDAPERMEGCLTVIPALDGEGREPYPGAGAHVRAVAWVDSETLLFLAEEGVWSILAGVGHDGTGHRTAVGPGRAMWNDIDVSRDGGSVALLGESPGHPSEVFLLGPGDPEPLRLTDSNPDLGGLDLASQEPVSLTTEGGLRRTGILIRPLETRPGGNYPLLIVPPEVSGAHYRNGWLTRHDRPGQVAAARGFAVYYPNEPLGELNDLGLLLEKLVAVAPIDASRVGIVLPPEHAVLPAWIAARVAAGSVRGAAGDRSDAPFSEHVRVHEAWAGQDLGEVTEGGMPTLILSDDPEVGDAGLARFLALQRAGAPVRILIYAGGAARSSGSRLDAHLRMLRWMEHYLQGPGGAPPPYAMDLGIRTEDVGTGED